MSEEAPYTGTDVFEAAISELLEEERGNIDAQNVAADLQYRSEVGLRTYGVRLQPFNGRDALIDLYEELLDAYVYATQFDMELDTYSRFTEEVKEPLLHVASTLRNRSGNNGFLRGREPQPEPKQPAPEELG